MDRLNQTETLPAVVVDLSGSRPEPVHRVQSDSKAET